MKKVFIIAALLLPQQLPAEPPAQEGGEYVLAERAAGETLAAATGHYARSRSMVLKALQEFDIALKYVDPAVILNIDAWRSTLLDRVEELDRILDIQPKATREGVSFSSTDRPIAKYLEPKKMEKKGIPIEKARGNKLVVGIRHYLQARDLLFSAVREFDAALKISNPQILLDVAEWRSSLIDCAEDLNSVVAPKPRESEGGVAFTPDSRLLNEAF